MNKIQELIEAGKKATQGEMQVGADIKSVILSKRDEAGNKSKDNYSNGWVKIFASVKERKWRCSIQVKHDLDFITKAANARTEIESLYTLAQEMAEALEALPLYSDKGSKKVWINCRVNGSAMWGLQNADKEIIESFEKIENMRQKALTKWTEFKK